MFGRLLPQEGRFFDLFNDHAEQIVLGAHQLVALMEDLSVAEQHIAAIETIEQAADKITHETVAQAHKSFITPLDRDEIHSLINAMDDILDTVQDVAECTTLYHIQRITPEAQQLATYLGWLLHRTTGGILAGALMSSVAHAAGLNVSSTQLDGSLPTCRS